MAHCVNKSIGQGVRGLRLPKIGGFNSLTLNVALTTVLRTNVLHCDVTISSLQPRTAILTNKKVLTSLQWRQHSTPACHGSPHDAPQYL